MIFAFFAGLAVTRDLSRRASRLASSSVGARWAFPSDLSGNGTSFARRSKRCGLLMISISLLIISGVGKIRLSSLPPGLGEILRNPRLGLISTLEEAKYWLGRNSR